MHSYILLSHSFENVVEMKGCVHRFRATKQIERSNQIRADERTPVGSGSSKESDFCVPAPSLCSPL